MYLHTYTCIRVCNKTFLINFKHLGRMSRLRMATTRQDTVLTIVVSVHQRQGAAVPAANINHNHCIYQ